jgi:uncharacterized membrane protein YhaH (DUF805 family)
LAILFVIVIVALGGNIFADSVATIVVFLAAVFCLPFLASSIAVGIKRLHDRGKSGHWLWLFYVLPGLLDGIDNSLDSVGIASLPALASIAISIWAIVELGCLRGTADTNVYGPDPLAA